MMIQSNSRTKIWTDGGTKSNSPPFGKGYGSFRIGEEGEIKTLYFSDMSANSAEILIMSKAILESNSDFIDLFSDSRIALNWLKKLSEIRCEVPENISDGMKQSIKELRIAVMYKNIKGHWRPRAQIFKIFKH